ncbi:casein kinase II subunit alpha [Nematocida displodere]|uniref:Casein kinase II subunit alpha n=1 Tax=Nematocida displodere TaxID=1805483 RepID=A0A177EJ32_9MICR|nr:casein kinase II subunit alpha [Nematocida displodere]
MVIETEARIYRDCALKEGREYYDYNIYTIAYGDIDKYKILDYMGKGKYSQVFRGIDQARRLCVIKVLKPVREKKINREIMILHRLLSAKNVVQMVDVVKDGGSNTRSLVFHYEDHKETRSLFKTFTLADIKHYSRQLLETLDHCHSQGIFHRDIKPQNLIINHPEKIIKIIDWGLAEFYLPLTRYSVGVASMHFKAPELLVNYKTYDYAIDLWAFGCVLCEMVLRRVPMFQGSSNEDQLLKIVQVLGLSGFEAYTTKYEIETPNIIRTHRKTVSKENIWKKFEAENNSLFPDLAEKEAFFSLIKGILVYDHQKRLTAKECLQSPFFT